MWKEPSQAGGAVLMQGSSYPMKRRERKVGWSTMACRAAIQVLEVPEPVTHQRRSGFQSPCCAESLAGSRSQCKAMISGDSS